MIWAAKEPPLARFANGDYTPWPARDRALSLFERQRAFYENENQDRKNNNEIPHSCFP